MRLYYMTELETAEKFILPERRMRVSRFDRLNDPFELLSVQLEGKLGRKVFKALFDRWNSRFGLMCMAQHWQSPVMWAHYADRHQGVCLGFDVPDNTVQRVRYTPERLQLVIDPAKPRGGVTKETLIDLLTTKYQHWSYEEEWRLFYRLSEPDPSNGEFYSPFGEHLQLREIIIGARCNASVESFEKLVQPVTQPVAIIKARPAFKTFTMVRQKEVPVITVQPRYQSPPPTELRQITPDLLEDQLT